MWRLICFCNKAVSDQVLHRHKKTLGLNGSKHYILHCIVENVLHNNSRLSCYITAYIVAWHRKRQDKTTLVAEWDLVDAKTTTFRLTRQVNVFLIWLHRVCPKT